MDLRETHTIGPHTRESIVDARTRPALAQHGINLAGLSQAAAPFQFVREQPRFTQILACVSGWGDVWLDDGWTRCAAGEAYVTPPDAPHGYRAVSGTHWNLAWVVYTVPHPPAPNSHRSSASTRAPWRTPFRACTGRHWEPPNRPCCTRGRI